ncbi:MULTISPECIES: HelD family protein [Arthrobacter]|uniref:AAA family ATPase n=1 Tax=Arthrobacter psychrochitiniphilus TaxID=291045 RepID=A0A2V3DNI3_9MICC|nr:MULTISPECIES: UvrD-helicase domain-containing protein [Arthrobacter]NYG17393.1 DNA helicase IV [Arthrobacter psychrochitiniphilus]PXA64039.1 AAA family ATPase [Arthrobacter psychrochitiniphilus]
MYDDELAHERNYVDVLYGRLDELRAEKVEQLGEVRRAKSMGTHQNRSERDAFATLYENRLAQLNAVDDRLVFGRLDLDDGQARYIGRIGLLSEDLRQLLIDWRAPEAGTFYQATAFDRMGVRRRRHLLLKGRNVKAIEDDVLDHTMLVDGEHVQGEGALLAALNSKRTGRMNDIVGTIQAEQDRIIRSPLSGALVVQGGPGTGKTAVALHRAAYLLYTHRERLQSSGVLLVGPSNAFMKYIERVLPSLGETGVVMASVGNLFPGVQAKAPESAQTAELKGRIGMAKIVANAVANRQRLPQGDVRLDVEGTRLILSVRQVRRAREKAQATGLPHNEARVTFVKTLLRELTEQLREHIESAGAGNNADRSYLAEDVRSSRDVRVMLNLCWMPMTAQQLIDEMFSKPDILTAVTPNLSPEQRNLLVRAPGSPWSESDVPLLDEAAELLGDMDATGGRAQAHAESQRKRDLVNAEKAISNVNQQLEDSGVDGMLTAEQLADYNIVQAQSQTSAERALTDRTWAYGHVVVDEAQELSPMQWRVLVRRCPVKSFTIVGDIAQTSSASGATSWRQALTPFLGERWNVEELSVNYRTPRQIAEAAVRMANAAGQLVSAPKAVRDGEWEPVVDQVQASGVVAQVVAVMPEETAAVGGGLVAVIAPPSMVAEIAAALRAVYGSRIGHGAGSLEQDIVVIDPHEAKGLEFDGVIIVEPAALLAGAQGRVGDLYVAMTRPTRRLRLIGSAPLPRGIVE